MIIINRNKCIKKVPLDIDFGFEKIDEELINIKSVSVQVRDVKMMIHSKDLVSLYAKFKMRQMNYNLSYEDDDYITISKRKRENVPLIYKILNADWLINFDDLNGKTINEISDEIRDLEIKISKLKEFLVNESTGVRAGFVRDRLKLLEYKLACLSEYVSDKDDLREDDKLVKRLIRE